MLVERKQRISSHVPKRTSVTLPKCPPPTLDMHTRSLSPAAPSEAGRRLVFQSRRKKSQNHGMADVKSV